MNFIIGAVDSHNLSRIRVWKDTADKYTKATTLVVHPNPRTEVHLLVQRFKTIADFIYGTLNSVENVIVTDVFDVAFQADPFVWMEKNMDDKKIVVGSEGLLYHQEVWGNNNLKLSLGEVGYEILKDNEIFCAGVIGGDAQAVADLCSSIYEICMDNNNYRLIQGGGCADQAAMNYLIQTQIEFHDQVKFTSLEDNFVCHCGTSLADNTQLQYASMLNARPPKIKDGKVYTHDDQLYTIVHQYNRVSALSGLGQ